MPQRVIQIRNPVLFAFLLNKWNFFKRRSLRCRFLSTKGCFEVSEGNQIRYASVNSRVLSYKLGFQKRARYLVDTYFLQEIDFRDGDLVVDCGANMGDLAMYFDSLPSHVSYMGYEPNPHDFNCLAENVGRHRARNLGLWKKTGILQFFVNDAYASSSFIEPPTYTQIVNIPTSTLEIEFPSQPIRLLKLEAEGAEPEVLEGALKILNNIDYVSADVGPERGVLEIETRDMVVNYLESNSFELLKESTLHRKVVLFGRIGRI